MTDEIRISGYTEALRKLFYDINSDNEVRADFLDDPIGTLKGRGIMLDDQAENEIIDYVDDLKEKFVGDLYLAPVGWEDHEWELMPDGGYIKIKGSSPDDRCSIT